MGARDWRRGWRLGLAASAIAAGAALAWRHGGALPRPVPTPGIPGLHVAPAGPAAQPQTRAALPPPMPADVAARLAGESRDLLTAKGLSPAYVDAHFTLLEAPDGHRLAVVWRFAAGEYETAVEDGLGWDYTAAGGGHGERHYRHGLEHWPAADEIRHPLPRADAEALLRDCMGPWAATGVTYGAPVRPDGSRPPSARLYLTGRTAPDAAHRVTVGTLDLETGACAADAATVRPLPEHRGGAPLPGPPTPLPLFAPGVEARLEPRLLAQLRASRVANRSVGAGGRGRDPVLPVVLSIAVRHDDAPLAARPQHAGPITPAAVEELRAARRRYEAGRVDAAVAPVADRLRAHGLSPITAEGSNAIRVGLPESALPLVGAWPEVIRIAAADAQPAPR